MNGKLQAIKAHYSTKSVTGESFISDHMFAFQTAGTLKVVDGALTSLFKAGDFRLGIRNSLARFVKIPVNGDYGSVTLTFSREFLQEFASERQISILPVRQKKPPVLKLKDHRFYRAFISSVQLYFPFPSGDDDSLVKLKLEEILVILLKVQPELKNILFDFTEPSKIDLKAYMEQNFRYNLKISRYAYLTGRSLSAFKRDFEKTFHYSPSKWLVRKRLDEAYFMIHEKKMKPLDVFMEVGFQDLSHFSYAFKKQFGISPSHVRHKST
ncbi:helix-turn-helix domain-containing protein [Mucilaginibacter endophyticus]|uniref:helix-turn-helix domain-containing protein n=1 Tax=Mucilaginibacter endophyticus TaxID=2675003 RepID=UPI000E0CD37A|nr:AraC family transcriptional regulator [Mucilaginibacter endophyticus]